MEPTFLLHDHSTWPWWFYIVWATVITVVLEGINRSLMSLEKAPRVPRIRHAGKHLDDFGTKDYAIVLFNKIAIPIFTYHLFEFCFVDSAIKWSLSDLTLFSTIIPLVVFYVIYDFFYYWFHRFLHLPLVYPHIHKHHHRQMAPTRGNLDAINTHPLEFVPGEYLHLIVLYMFTRYQPVHVITVILFLLGSGIAASLNHTRFDVGVPYLYKVRYHDTHHSLLTYNYEQYIPLWDIIFGTYKDTSEDDSAKRVKTN